MEANQANQWREFYWAAQMEEDSERIPERISLAREAIRCRMQVLPHGLDDMQEMKEIHAALCHLEKLQRKAQRDCAARGAEPLYDEALFVIDLSSWSGAMRLLSGALVCIAAITLLGFFVQSHSVLDILPLLGLTVVVFIGIRLGSVAGAVGSLLIALLVTFVAPFLGHLAVRDTALRYGVAWMVLGGFALSYLLSPVNSGKSRGTHAA